MTNSIRKLLFKKDSCNLRRFSHYTSIRKTENAFQFFPTLGHIPGQNVGSTEKIKKKKVNSLFIALYRHSHQERRL